MTKKALPEILLFHLDFLEVRQNEGGKAMPIMLNEITDESLKEKDAIYNILKRWIVEGKLEPAEKISDLEIAKNFHVSRTPVREALKRLEAQKLIVMKPGKSTIVSEIETDNIEQWYQPMAALQQLAARIAASRMTPTHILCLKEINEKFRIAIEENRHLDSFECDREFHDYILRIAGNEYIIDFCNTLMIHIQRLEYKHFRTGGNLMQSVRDHQKMIQAFEIRDEFMAQQMMLNNWNMTVLSLRAILGQSEAAG